MESTALPLPAGILGWAGGVEAHAAHIMSPCLFSLQKPRPALAAAKSGSLAHMLHGQDASFAARVTWILRTDCWRSMPDPSGNFHVPHISCDASATFSSLHF